MTQPDSLANARKRRILVAEDEDLILRVFEGILGKAGFEVVGAENGDKAVALFDGAPDSFDLVITDLALPGIPGQALAAHIRNKRPDMRIIFSTGNITDSPKKALEDFKGATFLPKPFAFDELVQAVNKALELPAAA
jgi:two-component system, cell cycle sensor histidine kinase and response regulator CckA